MAYGEWSDVELIEYDPGEAGLEKVTNVFASMNGDNILLNWDTVQGAESYEIEMTDTNSMQTYVHSQAGVGQTITPATNPFGVVLTTGIFYQFRVRAANSN